VSSAGEPILKGKRVLVIEDRYLIATDLCDEVAALGGEVIGPAPTLPAASSF
jgi:hypothetical protein